MRKSKPVLLATGLIWILIGYTFVQHSQPEITKSALEHKLVRDFPRDATSTHS